MFHVCPPGVTGVVMPVQTIVPAAPWQASDAAPPGSCSTVNRLPLSRFCESRRVFGPSLDTFRPNANWPFGTVPKVRLRDVPAGTTAAHLVAVGLGLRQRRQGEGRGDGAGGDGPDPHGVSSRGP